MARELITTKTNSSHTKENTFKAKNTDSGYSEWMMELKFKPTLSMTKFRAREKSHTLMAPFIKGIFCLERGTEKACSSQFLKNTKGSGNKIQNRVKENIRLNPQAKHTKVVSKIISFRDKAPWKLITTFIKANGTMVENKVMDNKQIFGEKLNNKQLPNKNLSNKKIHSKSKRTTTVTNTKVSLLQISSTARVSIVLKLQIMFMKDNSSMACPKVFCTFNSDYPNEFRVFISSNVKN